MSRELDSVTPNFVLTNAQIADLKRIMVDDEYAEEVGRFHEALYKQELEKLRKVVVTGISSRGQRLTNSEIRQLKKAYESMSGEKLDEIVKS